MTTGSEEKAEEWAHYNHAVEWGVSIDPVSGARDAFLAGDANGYARAKAEMVEGKIGFVDRIALSQLSYPHPWSESIQVYAKAPSDSDAWMPVKLVKLKQEGEND